MKTERSTQYPFDLARLVAAQLDKMTGRTPTESVLVRLFETLYFASLRTEEGWQPRTTVNFVDVATPAGGPPPSAAANAWTAVPFTRPLVFDMRTITKLARAADPAVSSVDVFADEAGELFIWGMVDQELRHGERIVLAADSETRRPGLFQATITGPGNIGVSRNGTLLGHLAQDMLVEQHFDVLWSGPVYELLAANMRQSISEHHAHLAAECGSSPPARLEHELLLRWMNSLSRVLVNIQQYQHGGGLVIVPLPGFDNSNVKYRIHYDRLSHAVVGLVRATLLRNQGTTTLMEAAQGETPGNLYAMLSTLRNIDDELEQRKDEVLGCLRFVAALSCVDGMVLLDKSLAVHGFGVELRTHSNLEVGVSGG